MKIRSSIATDLEAILHLLETAFGKSRYDRRHARHWIECFLNNPIIFPSFVAVDSNGSIQGYIVWKVRRVTDGSEIVIELQEVAALEGGSKLNVEETLYTETPSQVIAATNISTLNKCTIYVWVHDQDVHNGKSIFFKNDKEPLHFHGVYEKDDARGGMLRLYKKHLLITNPAQ